MTVSAGAALAEDAPRPDAEQMTPAQEERSRPDREQGRRSISEHRERLATPEAREERQRSRAAHRGLTRAEALELAARRFRFIDSDHRRRLSLRLGERLDGYLSDHVARIAREDGRPDVLAESLLPLRTKDRQGNKRAVDLGLTDRGDRFEVDNPLVPVSLPASAGGWLALGTSGLRMRLVAGEGSARQPVEHRSKLFYPSFATDADYIAMATLKGAEVFTQLRSPEAPETFTFEVDLPQGSQMRHDGEVVRIVKDGKRLGRLSAPVATDSQGQAVPVNLAVSGNRITMTARHRDGDYAYPILVDPTFDETYGANDWRNRNGLDGWRFKQTSPTGARRLMDCTFGDYCPGPWGNLGANLYIFAEANVTYALGTMGEWYFKSPGVDGSGEASYFYRVNFKNITHDQRGPDASTVVHVGLRDEAWSSTRAVHFANSIVNKTELVETPAADPTKSRHAVFGMQVNRSSARSFYVSASLDEATLYVDDPKPPTLASANVNHTGLPAGWVKRATPAVTSTATDKGLGVRSFKLYLTPERVKLDESGCGGRDNRCPASKTSGLSYDSDAMPQGGGAMPEGINNIEQVATDPRGQDSDRVTWPLKLDRTKPTETPTLSGSFYSDRQSIDPQRNTYQLSVSTSDPTPDYRVPGAGRAYSGIRSLKLEVPGLAPQTKSVEGCDAGGDCGQSVTHDFEIKPAALAYGANSATLTVTDSAGNERQTTIPFEAKDTTGPDLKLSGSLAQAIASGRDMKATATDTVSGVEKLRLFVNPGPNTDYATSDQGIEHPINCTPSCPQNAVLDHEVSKNKIQAGKNEVVAWARDSKGNTTVKRVEFEPVDVSLGTEGASKLGLEQYFDLHDEDAGGGSKVFVNGETGNTIWHSVPIAKPGRGLSTVVNLTYNSHDRGGLLGSQLGKVGLLDPAGAPANATYDLTRQLSGLSYSEGGVGFSLGISGPTRLNEPLGGALLAQIVDEGVAATSLALPASMSAPTAIVRNQLQMTLTDSDGTVHIFEHGDADNEWIAPRGVQLKLRRFTEGGTFLDPEPKKWAMTRPDGVTHFFDNLGYLTSTEDRNGNVLSYTYEKFNALTGETGICASQPKLFELVGDAPVLCAKRVKHVTDPAGSKLKVSYVQGDGLLGLSDGKLPLELSAQFPGLLGGSAGRISQISDVVTGTAETPNRTYDFDYDDEGYLTKLTEAANESGSRVTEFNYEAQNSLLGLGQTRQLAEVVATDGGETPRKTAIRYEARSPLNLDAVSDARKACGITRRNTGTQVITPGETGLCAGPRPDLETSFSYGSGSFSATEVLRRATQRKTVTTTHELDAKGRPTGITDPLGHKTTLQWDDGVNAVSSVTEADGAADATTTAFSYHQSTGALLSKRVDDGGLNLTTEFRYRFGEGTLHPADGIGEPSEDFVADLQQIVQPKSGTGSSFWVDDEGNVKTTWDGPHFAGNASHATHDDHGQITSETDAMGHTTTYSDYHAAGQPETVVDPRGKSWRYRYDPLGNLLHAADPRLSVTPSETSDFTTSLEYDAFDRVIKETVPKDTAGAQNDFITRTYAYDRDGNRTSATDGEGKTTAITYSPSGLPVRVSTPGSSGVEHTDYLYDDADRLIARVDPKGTSAGVAQATADHYECSGAPAAMAYTTRYCLDDAGRRLAEVRAAAGEDRLVSSFAYDARDRMVGARDPNRNRTATIAEAIAKAVPGAQSADPRHSFAYDKADRRTALTEHPSSGGAHVTNFAYDANGNLITETDPEGDQTTTAYDHRDLVVSRTDGEGNLSCIQRRQDGKVIAETSPRGTADDEALCPVTAAGTAARPESAPTAPGGPAAAPAPAYTHFTTAYTYDAAGNLTSRSIPFAPGQYGLSDNTLKGWKVAYERDAVGNPTKITDARGNSFQNTFYDSGELKSTERPSFFEARWGQTPQLPEGGDRFAASSSPELEISAGGPQLVERDLRSANAEGSDQAPGLPASEGHGNFGSVEQAPMPELLPKKGKTTFTYDSEMRLTEISDGVSSPATGATNALRTTTFAYDPAGRVTSKKLPYKSGAQLTHAFTYDAHGNLTSTTNGRGQATTFAYDAYDRLITETAPGAASAEEHFDATPAGEITNFGYDPNGNLLERETPRGSASQSAGDYSFDFGYDSLDRLISEQNPAGEKWSYGYFSDGNRGLAVSPRGNRPGADEDPFTTRLSYDEAGRLLTEKRGWDGESSQGDGLTTNFSYDADGNLTRTEAPGADDDADGSDITARLSETEFDGRGLPWRQSVGQGLGAAITITEYDENSNLRRTVNPKGISDGDAVHEWGSTEAGVHATVRTYDENDLLSERRQPRVSSEDAILQRYVRDERGNVESLVSPHHHDDPTAPRVSYTYLDSDWVKSSSDERMLDPDSNSRVTDLAVSYDYDAAGNQTEWKTDAAGESFLGRSIKRTFYPNDTLKERQATKRLAEGSDSTQRAYRYFYNANRSLISIADERGATDRNTRINRDPAEREIEVNEAWAEGKDSTFAYDENGNVTRRRTDGRIDGSEFIDGPASQAKTASFTYDRHDRESEMVVAQGSTTKTTESRYFPSGEMSRRLKANGTIETYGYTSRGQMAARKRDPLQGDTETQSYAYDANGNRTTDERGGFQFNARDQMTLWTRADDQPRDGSVSYERTPSGDLDEVIDTHGLSGGEGSTETTTDYTYEGESTGGAPGHRLSKTVMTAERPGVEAVTNRYSYDDLGSVIKVITDGPDSDESGPAPDEPDACSGETDTTSNTTRYCFDEFERMVFADGPGVERSEALTYDALDRRDTKRAIVGGSEQVSDLSYIGTSERLTRERTGSGKLAYYSYDSQGRRTSQAIDGTGDSDHAPDVERTYSDDANGSVLGLEDSDGELGENRYRYDPYGELQTGGSGEAEAQLGDAAKENPFRFEGFYYDSGIKTYDMQARQYRPDVGRFLSQDRYESAVGDQVLQADPLTQNRYAFAGGNPVTNVEFDGHCTRQSRRCAAAINRQRRNPSARSILNATLTILDALVEDVTGRSAVGAQGTLQSSRRPLLSALPQASRGSALAPIWGTRLPAQRPNPLLASATAAPSSESETARAGAPGRSFGAEVGHSYGKFLKFAWSASSVIPSPKSAVQWGLGGVKACVSRCDDAGRGLFRLFERGGAGKGARGGSGPVRVGQAGEDAVRARYSIGPKIKIDLGGRSRIPDGLTPTTLSEIKNVSTLSYSSQLRDFVHYAQQTGRSFDLYVRPTTRLSGPLQRAIGSGRPINLRFIP